MLGVAVPQIDLGWRKHDYDLKQRPAVVLGNRQS